MLCAEPEWEIIGSSAKDIAFDEFPVDDVEPPSWAARLCAHKGNIVKSASKTVAKPSHKSDGKVVASSPETRLAVAVQVHLEDDDACDFLDAKQLARESHGRQTGKGGSHTMRSRGHCPVQKNSNVSVVTAGDADPQDVLQLANVLRQVPVREVVKQTGGTCQEVKTREGRQANLTGTKMYDVTVPMEGPEDDVDVTYRVIEDARGGTIRTTRTPKCAKDGIDPTSRSRMPESPQTRKQQTCKKDIQEGMKIMGFA